MDNNNNRGDKDMMLTDNDTDDDNDETQVCRFDPNLVRKLLQFCPKQQSRSNNHQPPPPSRISNEAVLAAGELLRLFVLETRHRASIDAECEQEGDDVNITNLTSQSSVGGDNNNKKKKSGDQQQQGVQIRSDHITKVAAEMLMDFA